MIRWPLRQDAASVFFTVTSAALAPPASPAILLTRLMCGLWTLQQRINKSPSHSRRLKRAGNTIWGDELVPSEYSDANNCKNPKLMRLATVR